MGAKFWRMRLLPVQVALNAPLWKSVLVTVQELPGNELSSWNHGGSVPVSNPGLTRTLLAAARAVAAKPRTRTRAESIPARGVGIFSMTILRDDLTTFVRVIQDVLIVEENNVRTREA